MRYLTMSQGTAFPTRLFVPPSKTVGTQGSKASSDRQRSLLSDCADEQADLSLRWALIQSCRKCIATAHVSFDTFSTDTQHSNYIVSTSRQRPALTLTRCYFSVVRSLDFFATRQNQTCRNQTFFVLLLSTGLI